MALQVICPNLRCRRFLSVPEDVRGKRVICRHCKTQFRVPESKKSNGRLPTPPAAPAIQ